MSSPTSWMSLFRSSMVQMSSPNATWPWKRITRNELFFLAQPIALNNGIQEAMQLYSSLINVFGIILSALGIGVFWRKGVTEKNSFFTAMILISALDLAFNLVHLPYIIFYPPYKMNGTSNPTALWVVIAMKGVAFVISLVSDMCTMVLTAERCFAITTPLYHMKWTAGIRRRLLVTVGLLVIAVISLSRAHNFIQLDVVKNGPVYQYVASTLTSTAFVKNLRTFSDLILPFSLLILMVCLSVAFLIAIVRRQRSKSKVNAWVGEMSRRGEGTTAITTASTTAGTNTVTATTTTTTNKVDRSNHNDQIRQMVLLTLILDVLYISNQVGFTLIAISSLMKASITELTFDMNYDDMGRWCTAQLLDQNAALASRLVDCLSHSIGFVLYYAFSATIRREFRAFLSKFCK